jgi:hypothetical protein
LNETWNSVSEQLYKGATGGQQGGPGPEPGAAGGGRTSTESAGAAAGGKDEGPIIDAEVVDEKK